jgi:hypothetical protein
MLDAAGIGERVLLIVRMSTFQSKVNYRQNVDVAAHYSSTDFKQF